MGEHFQTIVDAECLDEAEAGTLGRRVLDLLIDRGIVGPEPKELEDVPAGAHPPGPRCTDAFADRAKNDERSLRRLMMNVVEVIAVRTVHHAGMFEFDITCPRCHAPQEPPPEWGDAVGEWQEASGPGMLACSACGERTPVTEFGYDPPYGFSCLGITFWNWPPLSESFVAEVGALLGHRVVLVTGKL